jgi:uncharacterized repeat protein (TIGR03943 family)
VTRAAQNLLLALIGAAVLWLTVATDEYLNFVRPWFRLVLIPVAIALIALGAVGLAREWPKTAMDEGTGGEHTHGFGPRVAWLLCLPIAAIFLIAPPALGAFTAARDTRTAPPPPPPAGGYRPLPATGGPTPMTMAEFISRAFEAQTANTDTFRGRPVSLTGFVTPRKHGGWSITRLRLNCCAGDALPLQVIVHDQKRPPTDSWVQVVGTYVPRFDPKHPTYELRATAVRPVNKPKNVYEGNTAARR